MRTREEPWQIVLDRWSQLGVIVNPKKIFVVSREIFGLLYVVKGGVRRQCDWVKIKDIAQYCTVWGQPCPTRNVLAPDVNSVGLRNPILEGQLGKRKIHASVTTIFFLI